MTKVLALIDADGLIYHSSKNSLEESILTLNEKIQNIYDKTQCTHVAFFISKGKYFRHNISPDYKANRGKYTSTLKYLKTLKSYLEEEYQANWMEGVEADDLIAYLNNADLVYGKLYVNLEEKSITWKNTAFNQNSEEIIKIICSPDKDLLQSIEGRHFNYTYKLEDKSNPDSLVKGWWIETTLNDSLRHRNYQLISGDASDNVITPFPDNCGIYNSTEMSLNLYQILDGYTDGLGYNTPKTHQSKFVKGLGLMKGIDAFRKTYRLLHLLETDEEFIEEIGQIPQLPKIIELNKITTNNDNSDGIDELFK